MNFLKSIYNYGTLLQFIGGLFSIILTVTVLYIKKEIERNNRKEQYKNGNYDPNLLGNINVKVDEEIPKENFLKLMTMWALQPLLLLVLLSFVDNTIYLKVCLFFGLLIFTLLHEFLTAIKLSNKTGYQILMLAIWIITFCVLSFERNLVPEKTIKQKSCVEQQSNAQHNE